MYSSFSRTYFRKVPYHIHAQSKQYYDGILQICTALLCSDFLYCLYQPYPALVFLACNEERLMQIMQQKI